MNPHTAGEGLKFVLSNAKFIIRVVYFPRPLFTPMAGLEKSPRKNLKLSFEENRRLMRKRAANLINDESSLERIEHFIP